jgi:hypothetical protein
MIEVRQGIRRLAKKVNPDASRVVVRTAIANSRGGRAPPPAGGRSDAATGTPDAARRQALALWWIVRLASDAPEHEVTERVATWWRQASGSTQSSAQRWRKLVKAVEAAVAETAGHASQLATERGMVAQDRTALSLILAGHDVADVAYLEGISVRDVHRRLRTGLTSLGSILHPTSNKDDDPKPSDISLPLAD